MDAKNTTIYGTELFSQEIKDSLFLHVPHSSLDIPDRSHYLLSDEELDKEIIKLTDIGTDQIFDLPNVEQFKCFYNRLYLDVERLPDEQEEMFKFGRGFFYTKTDSGKPLRTEEDKELVRQLYDDHHSHFEHFVLQTVNKIGFATIIDCHSFSDTPFDSDIDKSTDRPDICIGTDDFHTPKWLQDKIVNLFENEGLSVKINSPYSGTIVPINQYQKNKDIFSIMIEVNRRLFIKDGLVDTKKILELNRIIRKLLD